jgi:hypothetical protein
MQELYTLVSELAVSLSELKELQARQQQAITELQGLVLLLQNQKSDTRGSLTPRDHTEAAPESDREITGPAA